MNFEGEDSEGEDGDAIPLYAQFIDGNRLPGQKLDKKMRSLNTSLNQVMNATTKISESFNESVTMKKEKKKTYEKFCRETKDELTQAKLESLRLYKEHTENEIRKHEMQDSERVEHTVSSLKNHWTDMNRACKVYGTCLKNVMQGPISGMQLGNLNDAARTIYEARGKGKWVYKEAYEVLSCHQYYKILPDQHPEL
ncbi:hypothetical protein GIB67_029024 [Kingdonia uniflora]|uniref:Uncharacterized protein n=1 Tax=Kingdonia uniflora TaxID=39325 RepID=A0A7J7N6I2_9MAGN|nr:hypothetical protein GIB67_029024 [Kingdonia uniflora]